MFGRERPQQGWPESGVAAAAVVVLVCLAASPAGHSRVTTTVSWNTDIKPIVDRHCVSCHTSREAPIALDTYRDARPWARAIREEVLERRMPPWHARPGAGQFANERRMSPVEIDLVVAWTDGGAPEGKPSGVATRAAAETGWFSNPAVLRAHPPLHEDRTGRDRGVVFTRGVSRTTTAAQWSAVMPHCPDPRGSFSLSIEPPSGSARALLEIRDVSKPAARDPYRFVDPVSLPRSTRVVVGGSAGCSAMAFPADRVESSSERGPDRAVVDRDGDAFETNESANTSLGYWCPMHPEIQSDRAGACRRCSMTLVDLRVDLSRRYDWSIEARPTARVGRRTSLTLGIRERGSTRFVNSFERVHEQEMHLFIVSEDHRHFEHVHPSLPGGGSFRLAWTPPQPGRYKLFGDFFPRGGSPQVLQSLIEVEGPPGRALAGLRPTATHEEIRGGLRARLAYDDVVAGDTTRVAMVLTDSETGGLATDLRMFLGAAGHFIGVSDDSDEVIHAHAEAGETVHPRQEYEIRFPRAGRWSVWLQVQRGDAVVTFPFAITVRPKA